MKTAFIFTQKFDILTTYKFHYTTARILNTVQFCTCGVDPHTTSPAKVGLTKQFRWSVSLHVRCSGATARPLQRRRYFIIMPECMAYEEIFRLCVSCMKYEVCYMKLDIGVPRILQWRVFTRVDQEISKKGLSQGAWGPPVGSKGKAPVGNLGWSCAPPPPRRRRRPNVGVAPAPFSWRVHVMLYTSYMYLYFCNAVYNEAWTLTKCSKNDAGVFCNSPWYSNETRQRQRKSVFMDNFVKMKADAKSFASNFWKFG